jgi:plastocyanin
MQDDGIQNQAMQDHAMHQPHQQQDHAMIYTEAGMVMNQNDSRLPMDCRKVSRDYAFTIRAGVEYAVEFPGTVFGLNQHEIKVDPCSRVTITFINEDQVRHQWMLHGLPRYLYDQGMFTLEAGGEQTQSGTFIVPGDNRTYLVHCDLPQHMEKGMKGQLVVGAGSGNLWSIPGISKAFRQHTYLFPNAALFFLFAFVSGVVICTGFLIRFLNIKRR